MYWQTFRRSVSSGVQEHRGASSRASDLNVLGKGRGVFLGRRCLINIGVEHFASNVEACDTAAVGGWMGRHSWRELRASSGD